MDFSPSFWVAVSFFVFFAVVWRFLRRSFLSAINNYRNAISSSLNELYARRAESEALLEQSNEELEGSNLNGFVLNAHKIAKDIADRSKLRVEEIKSATIDGVQKSTSSVQDLLQRKVTTQISEETAAVVKSYLNLHQEKFNHVAAKSIIEVLAKKSK